MTILAKGMLVKNMYQNPNKQKTENYFWNCKFLFIGDSNFLIFVLENILAVESIYYNYDKNRKFNVEFIIKKKLKRTI